MTSRFTLHATPIDGVIVLKRACLSDHRGFFERLFCVEELSEIIGARAICQINRSFTRRQGAARGFHFQSPPHAELKIISCVRGRVLDVALDLRHGSPTFLQHYSIELSRDNSVSFVIPEGVAHGFQTLEQDTELLYLHTEEYAPAAESGVNLLDPKLGVDWPLDITETSTRDERFAHISDDYEGVVL